MKESDFYQLAKRKIPHWTWDRIESIVNSGQPDTTISKGFDKRRLELKIARSGKIYFQPSQISWARRMRNMNVWGDYVLVLNKENPVLIDYPYIVEEAIPYKSRKYMVILDDIPIKFEGWVLICAILDHNYTIDKT